MNNLPQDLDAVEFTAVASIGLLDRFRREFYACLDARADALFEVAEAVVCGLGAGEVVGEVVAGAGATARARRTVMTG